MESFIKNNKQILTIVGFILFFASIITNIVLLTSPNETNQQTITRLENEIEFLTDEKKQLASRNDLLSQRIDALEAERDSLNDRLSQVELEDTVTISNDSGDGLDIGFNDSINDGIKTENDSGDDEITLSQDTPLGLSGNGCKYEFQNNADAVADRKCNLVNTETGQIIKVLIDCSKSKYMVYPAGSEDICIQGADIRIGTRNALVVHINNFNTPGGSGQNLDVHFLSYESLELDQINTFFAVPRFEGAPVDQNALKLGTDFVAAYEKYVGGEVPQSFYSRFVLAE